MGRVARYVGREGDERVYVPELRAHTNPGSLLDQLRVWYGGELPGEMEAMVLAGTGVAPARGERALIVHLPAAVSAALRRDRVVGPLLRRSLSQHEFIVDEGDLELLKARLAELGIGWT